MSDSVASTKLVASLTASIFRCKDSAFTTGNMDFI